MEIISNNSFSKGLNKNENKEKNDNLFNNEFALSKKNNNYIMNHLNHNKIGIRNMKKIDNDKIITNPLYNYKKKIDIYYQQIFKGDIRLFFINSIVNENDYLNDIFRELYDIFSNIQIDNLEQSYIEKLITIICLLYYFVKDDKHYIDEDLLNLKLNKEQYLIKFLNKNILNSELDNFDFSKIKIRKFIKNFCKNLSLCVPKGQFLIFSAYTFLIIYRIFEAYPEEKIKNYFKELLEKDYLISFKIHFILKYKELYPFISNNFNEIFQGLYFINIFYKELLIGDNNNIEIIKYNQNNEYIFGKEKFILSLENTLRDYSIENLFSEEDNKIFDEVMNKISHFYSINLNNINDIYNLIKYSTEDINGKEYNFILNIVELEYQKRKLIFNNFSQYKTNLIKLEKQIFNLSKETLNINKDSKIINKYSINKEQKLIYNSIMNNINRNINPIYIGKFNLYPVGSTTEFLNTNNSDIDLYLDISLIKEEKEKISFIYHLKDILSKIINEPINAYISKRLCIIFFKNKSLDGNETDFDISITGLRSYFHSILFRTYSLIDPRFSLLGITLKKFVQLLDINSKYLFINSLCWMILLSNFLQDIIKPPILPKLLSNENNVIKFYKFEYGNYYNDEEFIPSFESFINNIQEKNIFLPESLSNNKSLFEIYKEQINNNKNKLLEKNELSCAELFLSFLEFIIFYFNKNFIYINCSIENEGYESINNILNNKDENFIEYFKNIYMKKDYSYDDYENLKDGEFLIRDPFDPNCNPAHTLDSKNFLYFINNLKKGYLNLLKYGDLFEVNR